MTNWGPVGALNALVSAQLDLVIGCENWIQAVLGWTGAALVSSGLRTVVGQWGEAG